MTPVEAAKLKKIMSDPVLWAKAFLVTNDAATKRFGPWEARDYQAEMLRDRSLKKVYRCGRRCLPGWVKIPDPVTGTKKTVKELYDAGFANVYCCDDTFAIQIQKDCPVSYNGKKKVFHITLEDKKWIDATDNHPFLTPTGWKELKDLKVGDSLAVPSKNEIGGTVLWKRITEILPGGVTDTYDLHVPEYHNFVANGIITHNTGKSETMVVEALWRAFTSTSREKFRILCITPYENQVNLLFMRMRELIHNSPLVKNEVVRMKNSPYMIEFSNGATILGFTTGASSGSGAASIRGQRGDLLLLDEIDYMGENDYSTVAMIAGERPDIAMICSSTPTGKRGTFYRMCKDPTFGFKEHFHPSMDNPNWNKQMEDEFRSQLTASQYEHEVLAEFGTEEAGVFDKTLIDAAMKREFYIYNPLTEMQKRNLEDGYQPTEYIYDENSPAPYNPFRCVGVKYLPL
nr:MAG TPA: Terminase [Caudoviricetes sp.]